MVLFSKGKLLVDTQKTPFENIISDEMPPPSVIPNRQVNGSRTGKDPETGKYIKTGTLNSKTGKDRAYSNE